MANTNYATATGRLNAQSVGFRPGAQGSTANRTSNTAALQAAIDRAAAQNLILTIPPGEYEMYGAGIVNTDGLRIEGTRNSCLKQYKQDSPCLHYGAPLGTPGTVIYGCNLDGLFLTYDGTAVDGGHALELTGPYNCAFRNLVIGNPHANGDTTDGVTWAGVYVDPAVDTIAGFSNTFEDIFIKNFACLGFFHGRDDVSQPATANKYTNIYISNGSSAAQRDISAVDGCPAVFTGMGGGSFDVFNIEWCTARTALQMVSAFAMNFRAINIEGFTSKSSYATDGHMVEMYQVMAVFHGLTVQTWTTNVANNLANLAMFRLHDDTSLLLDGLYSQHNLKTGITNQALFRPFSGAGARSQVSFHNWLPGPNHQIDLVSDWSTFTTGGMGVASSTDFANEAAIFIGDATSHTVYAFKTPGTHSYAPTATRNITLSRQLSATDTCRIPDGSTRTIVNNGSGAGLLQVKNYEGTNIGGTIALASSRRFKFDGTNWRLA